MSCKKNTAAIILAAGQGTRMKSSVPKVLHSVAGRPMLWYAATLARQVATQTVAIVVGHGSEQVQAYLEQEKANFEPFSVVEQDKQLGTGHAVQQLQSPQGTGVVSVIVYFSKPPALPV